MTSPEVSDTPRRGPRGPEAGAPSTIDIVSRIERVEAELSPAERRVAETVRQDFEAATRLTIAELAQSIMMNAANAIRLGLDQLDTAALGAAIDALAASRRIDIYGQGSGSS